MANSSKQYVTDLIQNDYKSWKSGDSIILCCGTGTGKSTFCIQTLLPYCQSLNKKILYVCNRTNLEIDIIERLRVFIEQYPESRDFITITKYQDIEAKFRANKSEQAFAWINEFDYIFLDECHYFISDAPMNVYTELTYKLFTSKQDSIIMYASATSNEFFNNLISTKNIPRKNVYELKQDYSFVDGVYLYKKEQLLIILESIIKEDTSSKIIVFCKDGDRIMEIYRTIGDRYVDVICSKNYNDKRVKEISRKKTIKDSTFEKRILVTTPVIDNGIDFKDINIKHIFTELPTMDSLIQSLGRKRPISEDDHCIYYIREYSKDEIKRMHRPIIEQLTAPSLWKKNPEWFYDNYKNDKEFFKFNKIMYFDSVNRCPAINNMAYIRFLLNNKLYENIEKYGFKRVLLKYLDSSLRDKLKEINIENYEDHLLSYLYSIEDKIFYREDLDELKTIFSNNMAKMGIKSKRVGITTMNKYLDERYGQKYKKRLVSKKDFTRKTTNGEDNEKRRKTYYVLE